jgi:hypothetical protein
MSDVPKFVRQRAAQQASGEHPDANLLAAFAEGGLTKGEREHVLAHLGACGACRDLIALALPETPAALPVPTAPEKQWLPWPMLRWAGVAAAVIVVAAVVVVKPHRPSTAPVEQRAIADAAEKKAEPKPPESASAPAIAAPARTDEARAKDSAHGTMGKEQFKAKAEKKEGTAGTFASRNAPQTRDLDRLAKNNEAAQSQGRVESVEVQSQAPAQSAKVQSQVPAAPPAAPPSAGGQVAGLTAEQSKQQQANASESQAAMRDQSQVGAMQSRPAAEQRATQQVRPAPPQATDAVSVPAAVGGPTKAARAPLAKAMVAGAIPRWRVSTEGAVERSIDGGRIWLSMRVAEERVTFRSVSSVDHDAWAGGAGGALYHSADDGRTWTRVTVKAFDMVLATDIARVEFTDAQHGSVTTTTGATWVTSDAGATWSLRAKPPL